MITRSRRASRARHTAPLNDAGLLLRRESLVRQAASASGRRQGAGAAPDPKGAPLGLLAALRPGRCHLALGPGGQRPRWSVSLKRLSFEVRYSNFSTLVVASLRSVDTYLLASSVLEGPSMLGGRHLPGTQEASGSGEPTPHSGPLNWWQRRSWRMDLGVLARVRDGLKR